MYVSGTTAYVNFTYSAFALYDVFRILRKLLRMVFDERPNNVFPVLVKN